MKGAPNRSDWPAWQWSALIVLALLFTVRLINVNLSSVLLLAGVDAGPLPENWQIARPADAVLSMQVFNSLLMLGFGALLLSRGRNNRAAAMLGVALISFGATNGLAPPWFAGWAMRLIQILGGASIALLWLLFCLEVTRDAQSAPKVRFVRIVAVASAVAGFLGSYAVVYNFATAPIVLIPLNTANQLLGYWILASGYRASDAAGRNRIKIVFAAFILLLIGNVTLLMSVSVAAEATRIVLGATQAAANLAALLLLAHAVLRQRLFDFSFALNRTLVYAAVSFVLLAAFGGAKWVIEHLIPESWHAGSEYYSFAIALGLFLVLHRVHTWVEHNVERVFFGAWHRNEAALRRFVAAAAHFEQAGELCRAFAEELRRFAGGAGAAVYRRDPRGAYTLELGSLEGARAHCSADDLALATMRAERDAVSLGEIQTALPGALALPMLHHGTLSGYALLGRKPDGSDYRPDEVEALAWAAQQVGLDLQAMHVGELEAEVAGLSARLKERGPRPARRRA